MISTFIIEKAVEWEIFEQSADQSCPMASWCDGDHGKPTDNDESFLHWRQVAYAATPESVVMEVYALQWKAIKPWRMGSELAYPNTDQPPFVILRIDPFSENPENLRLETKQATRLAQAMRAVGQAGFAEALETAATATNVQAVNRGV